MTLVRPDMIYFNGIDNFLPSKSLLVKSPCNQYENPIGYIHGLLSPNILTLIHVFKKKEKK
jgi:hypothetical protein